MQPTVQNRFLELKAENSSIAFTLLEFCAVLAVILIVFTIILARINHSREQVRVSKCRENLRVLSRAMFEYSGDHNNLLPKAADWIKWDSTTNPAWTRQLLKYYRDTNVLRCPSMSRVHQKSPFNYFMGSWGAVVESGLYRFTNVCLTQIEYPNTYILSGDVNHPVFHWSDADVDNNSWETLFTTNSPAHNGRVNVMFSDGNILTAKDFDPSIMTYSYKDIGVDWFPPKKRIEF